MESPAKKKTKHHEKYDWVDACIDYLGALSKKWWFVYAIAILLLFVIVVYLNHRYDMFNAANIPNIIAEVNGLFFDFLLFGIILRIYEVNKDKKEKIEDFFDELEDYKYWEGEESTYRRIGIIKRLLRSGVKNIDLTDHAFKQGKFVDIDLDALVFDTTTFYECGFHGGDVSDEISICKFNKCIISNVKFNGATVRHTDFDRCKLTNMQFLDTNFSASDFIKCKLRNCVFKDCDMDASFRNCTVYGEAVSFAGCSFRNADLDGMVFPFLHRDSLVKKFHHWIGEERTVTEILERYNIVDLDDPSADEATGPHHADARKAPKASVGCMLQQIAKGG